MKFGDVEVTFGADPIVNNVPHESGFVPYALGGGEVAMTLSSDERAIMEEAEISEMMVSDPEGWEQYNIDRLVHRNRASN